VALAPRVPPCGAGDRPPWSADPGVPVVRKIPCLVRSVTNHGEHVYTIELEPTMTAPNFKPGQFLHLALDPYDGQGFWPESRVFSIASSPHERDRLSITYAVKGTFTTRMERELVAGVNVWVKLPYGEFVIDPARAAVLFAGGTGVTAFTAFLRSLTAEHRHRVVLFYGARNPNLFVYGAMACALTEAIPSLSSILVSEETHGRLEVDAAWPAIEPLDHPLFYLSGPPQMLTALAAQLRQRGICVQDIRTDAWE
jgi:ferredoxin-NADP reductase